MSRFSREHPDLKLILLSGERGKLGCSKKYFFYLFFITYSLKPRTGLTPTSVPLKMFRHVTCTRYKIGLGVSWNSVLVMPRVREVA